MMMVMSLTGCTQEEAERALLEHENVIDAVDALLGTGPVVSGLRYIPAKPEIDHGLNEEQAERCAKGRDLQDKVNAVFSVAHSKTRVERPQAPGQVLLPPLERLVEEPPLPVERAFSAREQGAREQTPQ